MKMCECRELHKMHKIVLTGGPGAGKTAVLELVRQYFCTHVKVLPEAAGIVFGGGFPRGESAALRRAAQRAIFYVQLELEATTIENNPAIVICDRGTVDGVAYWPGPEDFWTSVGTTQEEQLACYQAVIHMRTPALDSGYNQENPLRIESAKEAALIDEKIAQAWLAHPRRFVIEPTPDFLSKAKQTLAVLRQELPTCCRIHEP